MHFLIYIVFSLAGFIVITSYKYLPLVYFIRFYGIMINHLLIKKTKHLERSKKITSLNSTKELFSTVIRNTYCCPLECDFFGFHKNNVTYLTEFDMCRTDLTLNKLSTFLINFKENKNRYPYVPLASIEVHYLKDIKPFQKYKIENNILSWDEKWLFLLSVVKTLDNKPCTISLAKIVFKNGRITIKPEDVIKDSGYDLKKIEDIRARNYKHVVKLVDAKQLLDLKLD